MSSPSRTVRDGIVVGLIGYAAVALFYSVFDLLAARGTFYTVNLLGRAVFRGLRDPQVLLFPVTLDPAAIVSYNSLHLAVALIIGLVVTWLVGYGEQHPARRFGVVLVIIAGFVVTILVVGALTAGMRPLLPWWSIVVANTLAVILAGTYLLRRRPGLVGRMVTARA
jgi:amino acid transporter